MTSIVVGVDGSDHSLQALEWAAEEARVRGAALRLVHAHRPEPVPAYVAAKTGGPVGPTDEERRTTGEHVLDEALAKVSVDGLDVSREVVVHQAPAEALIEQSRDADLLVLGSRGLGGFSGLMLGSVSQQCIGHTACPVVVLPGRR